MSGPLLQLMARIITHIPDDGDVTLVVLKGHLVVAEELNAAVASRVAHPQFLPQAELEFDQLLCVAKSEYFAKTNAWVWGAARKLNSIRNLYAHNIEPDNIADRLDEFLQLVEGHVGNERASAHERLRRGIAMLAAQIHHLHSTP